ncbi:variant surface glycoprotein (VSG, atypical), putative [Trypanosoma brucei brucei TREU927]|uniref:Variant surface glycoprotein (VSG, atypical), putative n=1 Tax=Trypanosoma brucei brucei (strain 927/4 GUTat10.1) TaxID=185431 RepID=Q38G45_TRYB2|nr:variant surface glycoprotein [Trypanosoma brucei brucei TREU927]EAN76225.1 variant surface glycoprotein (VSG, atypical), putative [Trypanosoma brucei brucei TREU927]
MIYIVLLALFALPKAVSPAANQNAAEYRALCDLIALKESISTLTEPTADTAVTDIVNDIEMLNISTATDSFIADRDGELKETESGVKKSEKEAWQEKIKKLDQETGEPKTVKYKRLKDKTTRGPANQNINKLLQRAQQLKIAYEQQISEAKSKKTAITTSIKNAIYGKGQEDFQEKALDTNDAKNNCGKAAGSENVGQSLSNDLVCLCIPDQGANGNDLCEHGLQPTAVAVANRGSQTTPQYTTMVNGCKLQHRKRQLTPYLIIQRLAAFDSLLGRQAQTATTAAATRTLGKPHSDGNCDNSATQGMCVNYKQQIETATTGIPWVAQLTQAAHDLTAMNKATEHAAAIKTQLESIQASAWAVYAAAVNTELNQRHPKQNEQPIQATTVNDNKCKPTNATPAECPSDHCVYDDKATDGNKCKPKPGTETTAAAGTGETPKEGAAATGCVAHKDKTTCENDKTGDKQNCAWRRGKDSEPDREKEMCLDSSSLVNKKLDLMAAAFVSLVKF